MYPFQDIIRELMLLKNLSRKQLAETIGVHETTIGQWLHGKKKPSYDSIMELYEKFGVEPNLLFGIER